MALDHYHAFPFGHFPFDDHFDLPPAFFYHDPVVVDIMPVVTNFEREADMFLHHYSPPGFDINEDDDKFQLVVDVPGVKAEDLKISLELGGRVLHVSGGCKSTTLKSGEEDGGGEVDATFIREKRFAKSFTIGNNIDTTKLTANLADGVLVVTAPKKEIEEERDVQHIAITEKPHMEQIDLQKRVTLPTLIEEVTDEQHPNVEQKKRGLRNWHPRIRRIKDKAV